MMKSIRGWITAGALAATLAVASQALAVSTEEKQININTASAGELAGLKGIGDAKAKAIVEHREKSGPFKSVDDLENVKGIGDKLLATLRPQVTVGSGLEGNAAAAAPAAPAPAKR